MMKTPPDYEVDLLWKHAKFLEEKVERRIRTLSENMLLCVQLMQRLDDSPVVGRGIAALWATIFSIDPRDWNHEKPGDIVTHLFNYDADVLCLIKILLTHPSGDGYLEMTKWLLDSIFRSHDRSSIDIETISTTSTAFGIHPKNVAFISHFDIPHYCVSSEKPETVIDAALYEIAIKDAKMLKLMALLGNEPCLAHDYPLEEMGKIKKHDKPSQQQQRVKVHVPVVPPSPSNSVQHDTKLSSSSTNKCVVCLDNDYNVCFSPCMHVCACEECAEGITRTNSTCPLCRSKCDKKPFKVFTP